jgi:hypothetical protein
MTVRIPEPPEGADDNDYAISSEARDHLENELVELIVGRISKELTGKSRGNELSEIHKEISVLLASRKQFSGEQEAVFSLAKEVREFKGTVELSLMEVVTLVSVLSQICEKLLAQKLPQMHNLETLSVKELLRSLEALLLAELTDRLLENAVQLSRLALEEFKETSDEGTN